MSEKQFLILPHPQAGAWWRELKDSPGTKMMCWLSIEGDELIFRWRPDHLLQVLTYFQRKAADYQRWLKGMARHEGMAGEMATNGMTRDDT